jgi:hypothetical protein
MQQFDAGNRGRGVGEVLDPERRMQTQFSPRGDQTRFEIHDHVLITRRAILEANYRIFFRMPRLPLARVHPDRSTAGQRSQQ